MSLLFHGLFIEFVSHSSNGEDPLRLAVIFLDCFSETPDVNVHRSWSNERISSPHAIEKLIPVQHAIGILDQETKQLKFFQGQFDRSTADKDFISGKVNFQGPSFVLFRRKVRSPYPVSLPTGGGSLLHARPSPLG